MGRGPFQGAGQGRGARNGAGGGGGRDAMAVCARAVQRCTEMSRWRFRGRCVGLRRAGEVHVSFQPRNGSAGELRAAPAEKGKPRAKEDPRSPLHAPPPCSSPHLSVSPISAHPHPPLTWLLSPFDPCSRLGAGRLGFVMRPRRRRRRRRRCPSLWRVRTRLRCSSFCRRFLRSSCLRTLGGSGTLVCCGASACVFRAWLL